MTDTQPARSEGLIGPGLLLLLLALVAFWPMFSGQFVYDDLVLIQGNPRVQGSTGLLESLGSSFWGFDDPAAEGLVGYWRPLTLLVLRMGNALGGSAFIYHLLSFLVHMAAGLAAWRLAVRLLKSEGLGFCAGAIFLLHPVQVEAVAWISAINDPLQGLFAILCLGAVLRWREEGSRRIAWLPASYFLLALGAKEQALALIPLIALLDFILRPGEQGRAERGATLRLWAPIAAVFLLYYIARVGVFGDALAGFDRLNAQLQMTSARALSLRFELFGGFLATLLLPLDLNVFRAFKPLLAPTSGEFLVAAAAVVVWLCATGLAWMRNGRLPLALLLFVPAALSPVLLNVDATGQFPLSERYLYLPVLALSIGLPWLLARLVPASVSSRTTVVAAIGLLIAGLFGARSFARTAVWQDEEALFRSAVLDSPRSPFTHWGLGRVLLDRYKVERGRELLDEAMLHFLLSLRLGTDYGKHAPQLGEDAPVADRVRELIDVINETPHDQRRLDPSIWVSRQDRLQANLGKGYVYLYMSEFPGQDLSMALLEFNQITQIFPESYEAWTALGSARVEQGKQHAAKGAMEQAQASFSGALMNFSTALELNAAYPKAWSNQGMALIGQQKWDRARHAFSRALYFRPGHVPYLLELARCSIEAKRYDVAQDHLDQAREKDPDNLEALFISALLAARQRQFNTALLRLDELLGRQDDHGQGQLTKARVLLQLSERSAALKAFSRACELMPSSFEAYYNTAVLLLESNPEVALDYLVHAYRLSTPGPIKAALHRELLPRVAHQPDLAASLSEIDRRRSDWAEAMTFLHLALLERPEWAEGHRTRGYLMERLAKPEGARAGYEKCLELAPGHFWATHDLALLLVNELDDLEAARTHLQSTLQMLDKAKINPEIRPVIRSRLERLMAGEKDRSPSFSEFDALSSQPLRPEVNNSLAPPNDGE